MGVSTVSGGIQSKEQFTEEDFTPKVRKPYTISKQRERWTEDEHKKFLEALKLHGRAWRKIEEHVGTKTAVQIRSHAQKYFSKVVRECNTNDSVSSAKPIEIPPPRPKRKPMHPYPRKLVSPVKGGFLVHEEQSKSASVNLSTLEQENQSPKSVLSAVGSDASAGAESGIHNGSPSPVSSAPSPEAGHECEDSSPDGQLVLGLNLLSDKNSCNKGDSKESGVSCFKLFGQTLSVEDPQKACKPESFDTNEETCFFPRRVVPIRIPASLGCIETSDKFPVTLPWLTLCGGASLSTLEVHNQTVIRPRPSCDNKEILDSHEQREGSSSGSSPDLVSSSATTEKNGDINSCDLSLKRKEKVEVSFSSFKLSKRNSASSVDSRRGFVPYKRCLVEMASNVSSTETCEAREKQRIRLC